MAYRGADPTDVMGRRIGAYLIDTLITSVILGAVVLTAFFGALQEAPAGAVRCPDASGYREPGAPALCLGEERPGTTVRYLAQGDYDRIRSQATLLSIAVSVLFNVLLQGATGATPGKFLVGLRVVTANGNNAGLFRCLVRTMLLIVDSFCCAIVGLVTAFRSRGHRRVGDMVANTIVVSRRDRDALLIARSGRPLPDRASLAAAAFSAPTGAAPAVGDQPTSWESPLPTQPAGWVAPAATLEATPPAAPTPAAPAAAAAATAVPGADAPTWDHDRGTYVQFDHELAAWMQWNDQAGEWRPIDT